MAEGLSWFKGNLHMHSLWSDGADFPEMVAERFKENGYHFIAFTEHDRFQTGDAWVSTTTGGCAKTLDEGGVVARYVERFGNEWVERRDSANGLEIRLKPLSEYRGLFEEKDRFLILNGEEVSVNWRDGDHWINVINAAEALPPMKTDTGSAETVEELVRRASASGGTAQRPVLISFNHPNYVWNAAAEDLAAAGSLKFFEVHTALNCTNSYGDAMHAGAERIWDVVLSLRLARGGGGLVYGIATDDSHVYHTNSKLPLHEDGASNPCRAWVMVRASRLTPDGLMKAMQRGDFYACTGVGLTAVDHDSRGIHIEIDARDGVSYTTRFIGTRRGADLAGSPVRDPDGRVIRTTMAYSEEVGAVLQETSGPTAGYCFAGDELYVRALVISDEPHPNPTVPGDVMKAWTQPLRTGHP
ncbi:PHP domain-containing protein [Verrucomicrobiota bacterium]